MFDGITSETKNAGKKVSSFAVSLFIHGGVIFLALMASAIKAALPAEEPVTVVFKAPPPPPPPPAKTLPAAPPPPPPPPPAVKPPEGAWWQRMFKRK